MATATLPQLTPLKLGPWRGRKTSTTRDLVPPDYIYTGQNALFVPNSEIEGVKGAGHWRRRDGQSILFDTLPSAAGVGLLPAKWGAHARWMRAFKSDSISDGQDTVIALVTKEDLDDDSLIDDGRFSQVYIRDQVGNVNYTLGSEYSATTYPPPGTEQTYKYIPVWYESGDGGLTRGVSEFDRRNFVNGARRFLKAQRWWYFPDRFGTPLRTQFGASEAAELLIAASGDVAGEWIQQDGGDTPPPPPATLWYIASSTGSLPHTRTAWESLFTDESPSDERFIFVNNAGAGNLPAVSTVSTPSLPTVATFTIRMKVKLTVAWGGSNILTVDVTLNDTNKYRKTHVISATASPGSWVTLELTYTAADIVGTGTANRIQFNFSGEVTMGGGFPDFTPGFYIGYMRFVYAGAGAGASTRLIPSGPIPPTWPGKLTTGSAVSGTVATETVLPDADDQDGGFTPSTGTDLFAVLDDTSTTDYAETSTINNGMVVNFATPALTPTEGDTVRITFAAAVTATAFSSANVIAYLAQGTTLIASTSKIVTSTITEFSFVLTDQDIGNVTDWTNVKFGFYATSFTAVTKLRLYYASLTNTPGAAEGGWKGSKRFFHSIAYVFEDGSTWMPVVPRLPSADNALGVGFFTVDANQPDVNFDKITWTLPKAPHGVTALRLLRGLSIDSTLDDNRLLNPFDMRVIATVPATADTYDDFASDDSSLEDDPSGKVIHFDHSMPPRTRYLAGGEQRVAAMYGGLGPCSIELAPIGATADYDLNFDDETDSIYGATYASYMRVSISTAGAGQLELTKSDGATLVATKTFLFSTYTTLQRLVDAINATTCAADSLQWRAQLAPGVVGSEDPLDVLMPHSRAIASVTTTSGQRNITGTGVGKWAVGMRLSGTGITTGTYVEKINSATSVRMSANATASGTVTVTGYTNTGDDPTVAETNKGWQRCIANSLPPFLYFNSTYLATFGIDKDRVWLTAASPFQTRSAANNFTTLDTHTYRPPADAGIGVGVASPERGFVLLWENARGYIANEVDGGTGDDRDYKVRIANSHQGCCAWDSVDAGNGFVTFAAPAGIFAAQIGGFSGSEYREACISDDIWRQWPDARGDFSYEMPLCQGATAVDDDTGKLSVRVVRNWIWCQYRASGTHPNRQIVMDFSAGADSFGLSSLMAEPGRVWPWSPPLVRSVTSICEVVRSNGSHIYAWNEENAGSTGDGRIDEIETGDTDNGTAISGSVESGWGTGDHDEELAAQEFFVRHLTPTGATTFLDFYRFITATDGPYPLTLTASGTNDLTDERKFLPQAARSRATKVRWVWRQTAGDAGELRPSELRLLRVPRAS